MDVLRGIAILGILLVNVAYFAFPMLKAEGFRWWEMGGPDGAAHLGVELFFTYKFITLFSLLFGMGLALQGDRADAAGRPFGILYARRLLVLLGFGLSHGLLLWYGDILTTYALVGFVALIMRRLSSRWLVRIALILLAIPPLLQLSCAALFPEEPPRPESWSSLIASEALTSDDGPTDENSGAVRFIEFMDCEERIYQSGPVSDQILHRAASFSFMLVFITLMESWRVLALFLLGMWLIRSGVLQRPREHRQLLIAFACVGLPLGVAIELCGQWLAYRNADAAWAEYANHIFLYLGSLGMSAGYLALVVWLCASGAAPALLRRFAAVGRMALTNYLGQSVACGLVFYSYGAGLFNRVPYAGAVGIALAIFAAQLVLSPLWLARFRFGPVEWLWRSLTYARLQPMLRVASREAAVMPGGAGMS